MGLKSLVKITNKTKDTILAEKAQIADTHFDRLKGLLGRASLKQGEGLIIVPCSSIHTFFMKFSIDVIFLNKNYRVVLIANKLPPWRLFGVPFFERFVIELPSGIVKKTNTNIGDLIEID